MRAFPANRKSADFRAAAGAAALAVLLGFGAFAAAAPAPSAFSATYGKWTVRCAAETTDDGADVRRCAMDQRFLWRDERSGESRQLLTVTLTVGKDGGMEATVVAPFGLLLAEGLRLRADSAPGTVLAFHTCLPGGCIARGVINARAVAAFRKGKLLHVEAEPAAGGEPFRLEGSLTGFSAAGARLLEEAGKR